MGPKIRFEVVTSTSRLIPRVTRGPPGLRRPLVSYCLAASLRCQARSVAGVTGNTSAQRRRDIIRASEANQARSCGCQYSVTEVDLRHLEPPNVLMSHPRHYY
jgi:hypothetical protein